MYISIFETSQNSRFFNAKYDFFEGLFLKFLETTDFRKNTQNTGKYFSLNIFYTPKPYNG